MGHERFEELTTILDTSLISRRQLLKGIAASAAITAFPILDLGRRHLAYAEGVTQVNASKSTLDREAYRNAVLNYLARLGPDKATQWLFSIENSMVQYTYAPSTSLTGGQAEWNRYSEDYESRVVRGEGELYRDVKQWGEWIMPGLGVLVDEALDSKKLGKTFPKVAIAGKVLKAYGEKVAESGFKEWDSENQITAEQLQYANYLAKHDYQNQLVDRAISLALQPDSKFRDLVDLKLEREVGVKISQIDGAGPRIINLSTLPVYVETAKNIKPGGSLSMSLDQLRKLCKDEFTNLEQLMKEQQETLGRIESNLDYLVERQKIQEEREAKAAEYELAINGAQASINLLSTLVGLGDKKLGQEIQVVGTSFVKIADSMIKFADSAANLSGVALGLSTAIMTGNYLGAVMNIVSLFQGAQQSPEQMIMEGINKLQEQVSELGTQMHDRFDRIDKGLNKIYQDMQLRFEEVTVTLVDLQDRVIAIQQELGDIDSELDNLTSLLGDLVRVLGQRELKEAINGAIGYKQRTGQDMTYSEFLDYENTFYTWAVQNASDSVEQRTSGFKFEDDEVLGQLRDPEDQNLTVLGSNLLYLAAWQQRLGFTTKFASAPLANPATWAVSSRAYSTLMQEWPSHARRIDPERSAKVWAVGDKLRVSLEKITLSQEADGSRAANRPLFEVLVENYEQKSGALDVALQGIEEDYLENEIWLKRPQDLHVDFWGDPWQNIGYFPELPSDPPDTQRPNTIPLLIPAPFKLRDYLGPTVGDTQSLSLRYISGWMNLQEVYVSGDFRGWNGNPTVCVIVNFANSPILILRVRGQSSTFLWWNDHRDDWPIHAGQPSRWFGTIGREDPAVLGTYWTWGAEYPSKARFEAGTTEELPLTPPEQALMEQHLTEASAQADAALQWHRGKIYKRINEQLGGALRIHGLGLSGAKALLDAFVSVGMPRALEVDDFVRGLLRGNQSLVDHLQVSEKYVDAALPIPVDSYMSLRSFNYPSRLVRHQDGLGEVMEVQNADKPDAMFKMVPGLADGNAISFESLNFPGYYLREQSSRVVLQPYSGDTSFAAEATFSVVPPLAGAGAGAAGASFRSHNFPDRYLRHRDFHIWVETGSDALFQKDATFMVEQKNPRDFLKQDTGERATAVQRALMRHLDAIERGDYTEQNSMLEMTQSQNKVVDAVVHYVDTIKPVISPLDPAPGSATKDRTPTISAGVRDNAMFLAKTNIQLFVDGRRVTTFSYSQDTEMLAFTPRAKLGLGSHTVKVIARDAAGNSSAKQWSFKIVG